MSAAHVRFSVTSGEDEPHVSDDASGCRGLPRAVPCGTSVADGRGGDFHQFPGEFHGKTMGKWWFNGTTIGKPYENHRKMVV